MDLAFLNNLDEGTVAALGVGFALLFVAIPMAKIVLPLPFPWPAVYALSSLAFLGIIATAGYFVLRPLYRTWRDTDSSA